MDGLAFVCLTSCRPRQWPTISREQFTDEGYPVYGANGQIGLYSEFTHGIETIAITCRGATCGTINLVPARSYITGNAMALDDLDGSIVAQSYLYQALQHWGVANSISGSAQPQITRQSLSHVAFPFPSLDEQRRIAEVLRSVDEAIAAANAVIGQLRETRSHRLEAVMALPGTFRRIDEICRLSGGYGFPIKHQGKRQANTRSPRSRT
jgi:type I restriction enzyme S subunit